MPNNEVIMGQHRHCLETIFECIEDHVTEDEELVTNYLETIVNLAPLIDFRIFTLSKPSYIKTTQQLLVVATLTRLLGRTRNVKENLDLLPSSTKRIHKPP